jgi:hypothetical protein
VRLAGVVTAGVAVLVLIAGFYVWLYFLRDTTTRTDVAKAVSDFRAKSAGSEIDPKLRNKVPKPGVYQYRTTGGEKLDTMIDSSHDFTGISTITLTPTTCGMKEHWQVLEERWSTTEVCLGPHGAQLNKLTEYHEFFGQQNLTRYTCREDPVAYTAQLKPGDTWEVHCRSKKGTIVNEVKVVSRELYELDGQRIPALKFETNTTLSGDPTGTARRIAWMRVRDGLLLKRESRSDARVKDAGGGTFEEEFTLELVSTTPVS